MTRVSERILKKKIPNLKFILGKGLQRIQTLNIIFLGVGVMGERSSVAMVSEFFLQRIQI